MKQITETLKAISDEKRLRILKLLEHKKMCVCELAYVFDVSQPAVSKHLKKMMNAGIIGCEQDGFWTNYFISPKNDYAKKMLSVLKTWLNDEVIIKKDFKKASAANRQKLCCM